MSSHHSRLAGLIRRIVPLAIVVGAALGMAAPAVHADNATFAVQGQSQGVATLHNMPGILPGQCGPNIPGSHGLTCVFDVHGTFSTTQPASSNGTYSGQLTIDYSMYNPSTHCAPVSGSVTFNDTSVPGNNTLTTQAQPGSQVCETANAAVHSTYLILKITGGTGIFSGATGTIYSTGTTTDTATPGAHTDQATLTGNISFHSRGGDHGHGHGGHGDDGGDD